MRDIEFDADDARALARVARDTADTLRGQSGARDGATTAGGQELTPVLHHAPLHADGHGYLNRDTEAVHNVGLATTGRDAELTPGRP